MPRARTRSHGAATIHGAPVTHESLLAIVDHWDPAAMALCVRQLRLMERLDRAQIRKAGGADEGAVEKIKRLELDTAWCERRSGNTGWGNEPAGVTEWAMAR